MMNIMQRNILTITVAFLAGGLAGFLLSQKRLEEKYANAAEEDAREVREYYLTRPVVTSQSTLISEMESKGATDEELNLIANLVDKYQQHGAEDTTATEHYSQMVKAVGYSSLAGNRNEQAKRNYNLVSTRRDPIDVAKEINDGKHNNQFETFVYNENSTDAEDGPVNKEPYVIEEEDFSEEFLEHDKICLVYYAEDDTLTEEDESIVTNPTDLIGFDLLDMNNASPGHPHTIYIRNEKLRTDYEVLINLDSFQRVVMGIEPGMSPRQAQERRMKMRGEKE